MFGPPRVLGAGIVIQSTKAQTIVLQEFRGVVAIENAEIWFRKKKQFNCPRLMEK